MELQSAQDVAKFFQDRIIAEGARFNFPHKVTFDFGESGAVSIDGIAQPPRVESAPRADAEVAARVSLSDFNQLVNGKAKAPGLLMTGKLKVTGDTLLMMKLRNLIQAE